MPRLAEVAKGLGAFPLSKIDAAVHGFWAFKPSLGDTPTAPAVALQIYALATHPRWPQLLAQVGNADTEGLPRKVDDLARASQIQELMRRQRRGFKKDPELGTRLRHALVEASDLEPRERRLMQALVSLYEGGDHRYLNFYGPPGTITTIPYHAILKGDVPNREALDLAKKIIFVGYSDLYDPGQPDRHYTVLPETTVWI